MASAVHSLIPAHLQRFKPGHAQSLATDDFELVPPHWRLPHKQSLRTKLKQLRLRSYRPDERASMTPERPKMRMEESDDYITARGANPRTGLVSPSFRCPSPGTPGTPGEALMLSSESPTPGAKAAKTTRPALARGYERKTSAGRWRQDEKGWVSEPVAASPRTTTTAPTLEPTQGRPCISEDAFVCKMPSAAEPQPYAYPGHTAAQIEAFEHYKRKARRVSGKEYGRPSSSDPSKGAQEPTGHAEQALRACSGNAALLGRAIWNVKGAVKGNNENRADVFDDGLIVTASSFAPFRSPRTPAMTSHTPEALETLLHTIPGAFDSFADSPASTQQSSPQGARGSIRGNRVARNPTQQQRAGCQQMAKEPRASNTGASTFSAEDGFGQAIGFYNICQLPKVRLVHPQLASLPQALRSVSSETMTPNAAQDDWRADASSTDGPRRRNCSLGCAPAEDGDSCTERSTVPNGGPVRPKNLLFGEEMMTIEMPSEAVFGKVNIDVVTYLTLGAEVLKRLCSVRYPRPPPLASLDALFFPDATPQEKVAALKSLLAIMGHAIAFLTVTTMLWRIGSAISQALEAVLWPVVVLLKLVRWLLAG